VNGKYLPNIKTADECRENCINRPHCIACEFDYSTRDTRGCWLHDNAYDLRVLYNAENVTHYELASSCPERRNGPAASEVINDGGTFDSSSVVFPTTDSLDCAITWPYIEDQTSTVNGIHLPYIKTVDECLQDCVNRPYCIACEFDYSTRQDTYGCWYHVRAQDLDELFNGVNVIHFQLASSCPERRNGPVPARVGDGALILEAYTGLCMAALATVCVIMMNQFEI
jgi:hypothetical protein